MGQMFYGYGEHVLMGIIAYNCKKQDKIGTQTCYIHQCTKRYVDVHSNDVCVPILSLFIFMQSLYTLQIS